MSSRLTHFAARPHLRSAGALLLCVGAAIGAAGLMWSMPGCASGGTVSVSDGTALDDLRRQAQRESRRSDANEHQSAAPPGLILDDLSPIAPNDPIAGRSLAEAVEQLARPVEPDRGPSEATPVDALRLYASGRAALLDGDLAVAERDLREAVELDPWSPEARSALAEAMLLRGNRIGAAAEFRAALERNPEDLRALERLGREAAALGDDERAAELLGRAWTRPMERHDAGLPYLIAADLGLTLHRLGWYAAGNEALERAARIPEPFPSASRYGRELSALYRARPDYWRDIGDAALRLGDRRAALAAYAEAAAFPTLDDGSAILLRRIYAALGAGSPSAAAVALVEDAQRVGRFEERHVALTRHIAVRMRSPGSLLRAIDETAAGFEPETARRNVGLIVRTRAAAMDDDEAIAALRGHLTLAPADSAAMADFFARIGRDDPGAALRETIRLIEASPMNEPRFTRGLFAAEPDLRALAEAWGTIPRAEATTAAGKLLRARIQATRDPLAAEEALAALLVEHPAYTPALVARIETLVQLGRLDEADAALELLDEDASAEARYAKTLALQAMQRYRDALDMLDPLLPPIVERTSADPQHVLRAAELSVAVSDFNGAAGWYGLLAEIDPTREEAYAGLIMLFAANGPLANETKLTHTLRALRESAPSSRTIRRLAAREMASVGQSERAARELQDLFAEDPADRDALALLVTVWLSAGRADLAEPWLRERIEAAPDDGALISELARTLAQAGRAEEAESILRTRLEAAPEDWEAARRLETLLRGPLERPTEADALAAARLARAPRTPETAIELAEVQIRRGAVAEAAEAVRGALGAGVTLRPDQVERLSAATIPAAEAALRDASLAPASLELIEAIRSHSALLPDAMHRARIALLSLHGQDDLVLDAVREATRQAPGAGASFHGLAIQALRSVDKAERVLEVAEDAGRTFRPLDAEIGASWLLLAIAGGDTESSLLAVRTIVEDNRAQEVVDLLTQRWRPDERYGLASDFAHLVGNLLSQEGAEDGADALYRLSLEYNPRHAMSNNNLGYRMLERGDDLDEAERLIAIAHEEMPEDVAILDSLGWARYLRGKHKDFPGLDGAMQEGSVTLLKKAAALTNPEEDYMTYIVVQDHLGDALWASGRADEAVDAWTRAERIARRSEDLVRANNVKEDQLPQAVRQLLAELRRVRPLIENKLEAVAAGEEPKIATPLENPARRSPDPASAS